MSPAHRRPPAIPPRLDVHDTASKIARATERLRSAGDAIPKATAAAILEFVEPKLWAV